MLDFQQVKVQYEGEGQIVQLDGRTVKAGQCIVLSGRSGSGKTTVTRMINGLLPELFPAQTSGVLTIGQFTWPDVSAAELAQTVGSVFQNPQTQFFLPDVVSELVFGCENQGVDPAEIERRLAEALTLFDLHDLAERPLASCSGGQKQRIAFAAAYMNRPQIMVLDEPTSQLDPTNIERIRVLCQQLKNRGTTLIIAEHRLHYLAGLLDELWLMEAGNVIATYTSTDLKDWTATDFANRGLRPMHLSQELGTVPDVPVVGNTEITLHNVRFRPERRATFEVAVAGTFSSNEIVVILGDNGAGKTTLVRGLAGLLPIKGAATVQLGAGEVQRWKPKERLAESFLVMQDVHYQLFAATVAEEVALKAQVSTTEQLRILTLLQLDHLQERHPQTLSGGEQQRLAIATALCSGKKWLFFDEPTSGLDADNMERMHGLLRSVRDAGYWVWVITHDPECYLRLADRFLIYQGGQCIANFSRYEKQAVAYFHKKGVEL